MRKATLALALFVAVLFNFTTAQADTIWGNNAGGSILIEGFDSVTGVRTAAFATGQSGNGRGIVVVGDTIYYTMVGNGTVFKIHKTTGASLGSFNSGLASLSTISFDGTNFWMADYSGTNRAFLVSPTGTLLNTINLANATAYMDGLEYFNGKLIANRTDGGHFYDTYDLNGNLLTASFINNLSGDDYVTGIAFDGTNFYSSNATQHTINVYNGTTGAFIGTRPLVGYGGLGIEDLSFDFATRPDTCGGPNQPPCATPEPTTLVLLGSGLGILAIARRRKVRA